jgi:hypothetical protein
MSRQIVLRPSLGSRQVRDATRIGTAHVQPCFLYGVFRFAQRAQHAVGHRPHPAALGLELLRQSFLLVHRSHSFVVFRHSSDERNPSDLTGGRAGVERRLVARQVQAWMYSIPVQQTELKECNHASA